MSSGFEIDNIQRGLNYRHVCLIELVVDDEETGGTDTWWLVAVQISCGSIYILNSGMIVKGKGRNFLSVMFCMPPHERSLLLPLQWNLKPSPTGRTYNACGVLPQSRLSVAAVQKLLRGIDSTAVLVSTARKAAQIEHNSPNMKFYLCIVLHCSIVLLQVFSSYNSTIAIYTH